MGFPQQEIYSRSEFRPAALKEHFKAGSHGEPLGMEYDKYPDEHELSIVEKNELIDELVSHRAPEHKLTIGQENVSVYRLTSLPEEKKMGEPVFRDRAGRRLLVEGRKAYSIFGVKHQLDEYDRKAYTNAVLFEKKGAGKIVFLRHVPLVGSPRSTEDNKLYSVIGSDGSKVSLREKLIEFTGDPYIEDCIAAQSRLCSLEFGEEGESNPHAMNGDRVHKKKDTMHLPVGFALASQQFYRDWGRDDGIITGQLHDDLTDNKLSFDGMRLPFRKAAEFLNLGEGAVDMDRDNAKVARHILAYIGYCGNLADLVDVFNDFVTEEKLSEEDLNFFLPSDRPWKKVVTRPSMSDWSSIGALFNIRGDIGEEVLKRVGTAPRLRLMCLKDFDRGSQKMVDFAQLLRFTNGNGHH